MSKVLYLTTISLLGKSGGTTYSNRVLHIFRSLGNDMDVMELSDLCGVSLLGLKCKAILLSLLTFRNPVFLYWQSVLRACSIDYTKFDFVVADHVEIFPFDSPIPVFLVAHNVETDLLKVRLKKILRASARIFERSLAFEVRAWRSAEMVLTISSLDCEKIRKFSGNGFLVPPVVFGSRDIDTDPHHRKGKLRIGFIGSIDWHPNREALLTLLDEICPNIEIPFQIVVAGANNSKLLDNYSDRYDLVNLGRVESVDRFWDSVDCLVCPIKSGAGASVKAWEAVSFRKPIFGTNLSVRGLPDAIVNERYICDDVLQLPEKIRSWWEDGFAFVGDLPFELEEKNIYHVLQSALERDK